MGSDLQIVRLSRPGLWPRDLRGSEGPLLPVMDYCHGVRQDADICFNETVLLPIMAVDAGKGAFPFSNQQGLEGMTTGRH